MGVFIQKNLHKNRKQAKIRKLNMREAKTLFLFRLAHPFGGRIGSWEAELPRLKKFFQPFGVQILRPIHVVYRVVDRGRELGHGHKV